MYCTKTCQKSVTVSVKYHLILRGISLCVAEKLKINPDKENVKHFQTFQN